MDQKDEMDDKGVSRRQMLVTTGVVAVGAALAQFGGLLKSAEAAGGSTEKWPWPYEKLDPAVTA